MLRKSLRTIDKVGEEIFDHPIRNAKIVAGAAAACLIMEKIHEGILAFRERSQGPEEQPDTPQDIAEEQHAG